VANTLATLVQVESSVQGVVKKKYQENLRQELRNLAQFSVDQFGRTRELLTHWVDYVVVGATEPLSFYDTIGEFNSKTTEDFERSWTFSFTRICGIITPHWKPTHGEAGLHASSFATSSTDRSSAGPFTGPFTGPPMLAVAGPPEVQRALTDLLENFYTLQGFTLRLPLWLTHYHLKILAQPAMSLPVSEKCLNPFTVNRQVAELANAELTKEIIKLEGFVRQRSSS
jgi:hypothetical protein